MMTPLRFEELYRDEWAELEAAIDRALVRQIGQSITQLPVHGDRIAALYRRACGHLALARARAYPTYIVDRLERITADAHQLIYYRPEFGIERVRRIVVAEFPCAVRQLAPYVAVATATFLLPALAVAVLVYVRPEFVLSVVSPETAASFRDMYSPAAEAIGRPRDASTDWFMFGMYIRNNISVAFQCFAGGLFAGVGSLFFLAFNGAFSGAIAGYLTRQGLSPIFFSFVVTHSSLELTAIVLSGAAGLRIGHAVLSPGRQTRRQSVVSAARDCAVVLYGVTAMLIVAAAIEAFWSSASWLPPPLRYSVAACCWTAVLAYFTLQGRRAA